MVCLSPAILPNDALAAIWHFPRCRRCRERETRASVLTIFFPYFRRSSTTTRSRRTVCPHTIAERTGDREHESRTDDLFRLPQGLAASGPMPLRPGTICRYGTRQKFSAASLMKDDHSDDCIGKHRLLRRSAAATCVLLRLLPWLLAPSTSSAPLSDALPSSTTAEFVPAVVSPWLS